MPYDTDDRDPEGFLKNGVTAVNTQMDGAYFRVPRDSKWQAVCFSDLTNDEREQALSGWDDAALRRLCFLLADVIKGKCTRRCGDEVI